MIPNLVVPAASFNYIAAAVLAFLGMRQFLRGGSRWSTVSIAVGFALATAAFLVWATAGKSFSLTGMLSATVVAAVPIALGGLAGVLSERVAVVNIAIEGMLLAGAFTGALMGSLLGGWAGVLFAVLVGGMFGFILAALVVTYRMDQIIAGVVITLFVTGVTSYVSSQVFFRIPLPQQRARFPRLEDPSPRRYPGDRARAVQPEPVRIRRSDFGLRRDLLPCSTTRYGLRARSVGEHPRAADTLGINVYRTRYINVTLAGMVAGFGGAWFTLGSVGRFDENMTGGLGYIGLAAMIFGRWHPFGALMAALIFGFRGFPATETGDRADPDPLGIPRDGALSRDDRRRRRLRRQVAPARRRRQALRQGMNEKGRAKRPALLLQALPPFSSLEARARSCPASPSPAEPARRLNSARGLPGSPR